MMEVGLPKQEDADQSLPLSSLRLLVPPLRLMSALLWRVMQQRNVMQYGILADFVSLVSEAVPELFSHTHGVELILGLRAKLILELCCRGEPVDTHTIQTHLNSIQLSLPLVKDVDSAEVGEAGLPFVELVQTLIKNTDERDHFFQHIFPVEFGPDYDSAIQTLMWDFLSQLGHFLPVPDLLQTVDWLGSESSVLKDCEESISNPDNLKSLLHHHKFLGHLDAPASSPCLSVGGCILSALSGKRDTMHRLGTGSHLPNSPVDSVPAQIPECVMDATDVLTVVVMSEWADGELDANLARECLPGVEAAEHGINQLHADDFQLRQSQDNRTTRENDLGSERGADAEDYLGETALHCKEGDGSLKGAKRRRPEENVCDPTVGGNWSDSNPAGTSALDPSPCMPACAHEESTTLTHLTAIRRSAREPKKTWKIKMVNLQKQKRKPVLHKVVSCQKQRRRPATVKRNSEAVKELNAGPVASNNRDSVELSDVSSGLISNDGITDSFADVSSKVFSCPMCPFTHAQERYLKSHIKKIHPVPQEDGKKEPHMCQVCGKGYRYPGMLKAHERTHTGEQPFQCTALRCGRRFSHIQALRRHRLIHASRPTEELGLEAKGEEPGASEPQMYCCLYCGQNFSSLSARRDHHRSHAQDELNRCSDCGKRLSCQAALVRHKRGHLDERPHKCTLCEATFACVTSFKRHLLAHRPDRPYRCGCGKGFTYRGALLSHQRIHTAERPYQCAHCDKSFLYPGALRKHEWTHSKEKPHLCSHCGKSFKRERTLRAHMAGHTKEKTFRCSLCDKTFAYKASLTRHELTHTGERPFLCADCGKSFFSFGELLKHQRYHTGHKPFQCSHCDKSFTQACYLQLHMRYHTGVRPYTCPQCGKSFFTSCRLKRHMQIHTGEKPFECTECGKRFRQAYVLKVHRRTHVCERTGRMISDTFM